MKLELLKNSNNIINLDFGPEGGKKLLDEVMEPNQNQDQNANKLRNIHFYRIVYHNFDYFSIGLVRVIST